MSSVMLFLEIERIKNKVDPNMNWTIWTKFFPLLADPDSSINLTYEEFQMFLVSVAEMSRVAQSEDNAALASAHSAPGMPITPATTAQAAPRPVLNIFQSPSSRSNENSATAVMFRKNCQKLLKHYTLSNTSTSDFKVSDIVSCMIYLAKAPRYKPLYALLESSMSDDYECTPNYTADQMHQLVELIKSLLDLPTSTIDFGNIKLLKNTFNKAMNYPISRFARIMMLPTATLARDKHCTIEELILERGNEISKIEPEQCINASEGGTKIPYCDDEHFINDLLKLIDDFSLHRMFYNAANSIFYTTMENYAVANCKFDVNDYNNIFRVMDNLREYDTKCGLVVKRAETSDSLNIYLGNASGSKRKKY
nr:bv/odv-c42 [Mamestra configurata nucleopolyhedrovirus A]WRQ96810.1 bv/odv-c42 [Mamestra configurata nucleopolyhedrovirus B]WRQ96973.1 bv/odv-c42 [Mamestra configurata nucleopolyhedrovirus B]